MKRSRLADASPTLPALELPAALRVGRRRGGKVSDYTGADIFRVWPDGYKEAVRLIGEGVTVSEVSRRLGLARNTVAGIRDYEANSATLEQQRAKSAGESRSIAALARDKQRELLTDPSVKFKARDLPALTIAAQQAEDMAERLTGGAAVRVEHVLKVGDDDFDQVLRAAKRAQVIDTHPAGERLGDCRGAGSVGVGVQAVERVGLDARGEAAGARGSDLLSDGRGENCQRLRGVSELSPVLSVGDEDLGGAGGSGAGCVGVSDLGGVVGGEGVAAAAGAEMPNGNSPSEFSDIDLGDGRSAL